MLRVFGVVLVGAALAVPPVTALAQGPQPTPTPAPSQAYQPKLLPESFIMQDDSSVVDNDFGRREATLTQMHDRGARYVRFMVTLDRVRKASDLSQYDAAVTAIQDHHLKPMITIASTVVPDKPETVTSQQIVRLTSWTVAHFAGQVDVFTIYNEPNCRCWPRIRGAHSVPVAFRRTYNAAYRAARRAARAAGVPITVLDGPLSGGYGPITFLKKGACRIVNGRKLHPKCRAIITDGIALNAYLFTKPPKLRQSAVNGKVTLASTLALTRQLVALCRARALLTPEGHCVPIWVTEFGYVSKHRSKGKWKKAGLLDWQRAQYVPMAINVACSTPNLMSMAYYGWNQPPWYRHNVFDTSIFGSDGKPDLTATALGDAIWSHKKCFPYLQARSPG